MPTLDDKAPGMPVGEQTSPAAQAAGAVPARALLRLAAAVQRKGLLDPIATAGSRMPSPCINVCTMAPVLAKSMEPLCQGCLRSLPEIIEWGGAASGRQQAIWRDVLQRMDALQHR